ncbi:MAG: ATP synthase F1 subunit delta [Deltaproteobacteria bacterium]|nr:ATP synthase F1 subunit delta [Deltaproteobacteria bacterium]
MSRTVIAKRYAQALLNLATREKKVDEVGQELGLVAEAIQSSRNTSGFMADPKIDRAAKERVMEHMAEKAKLSPLVSGYLRYLSAKGRMGLVGSISGVYHTLADEKNGRAVAQVTVAHAIGQDTEEEIRKYYEKVSGKKLNLVVNVDPGILGGAMTKIGSIVRDGSLRNHLRQLKTSIIQGKVEKE